MAKGEKTKRRRLWLWIPLAILALLGVAGFIIYAGGEREGPGTITGGALADEIIVDRAARQQRVFEQYELGERPDEQILFGDVHVHTTFSADAFMMSLPLMGGEGAHPPADACDYARFCSGLDFFALTDHGESLSEQHWQETIESLRQCDALAGNPEDPDLVPYMGWEWSQVGLTPEEHYGHRCVIFRDLDDEGLPARPIGAPGLGSAFRQLQTSDKLQAALVPILDFSRRQRYLDLMVYLRENSAMEECPPGIDTRELPADCIESAATPDDLLDKLGQWGLETLVIPHGTTWGFYSPPGYTWGEQAIPSQGDEELQRLIEVFSGHGNSEEYREWRAVEFDENGEAVCPEPSENFEPCCWRAGEIIRSRCGDASAEECERRVQEARTNYLGVGIAGYLTVPGATVEDWGNCGQCQDCFLPPFNHRPGAAVQYILALGNFADPENPDSNTFGFVASSDNHTARPGTGYKEYARSRMTEATGPESEVWRNRIWREPSEPTTESLALTADDLLERPGFTVLNLERQASFWMTGGLVAVHSQGRSREAIWEAMQDRNVYGTSGPRILLWFDLLNGPEGEHAMGSEVHMGRAPRFVARAVGSFEQLPGCPDWSTTALTAERLEHLCAGECYNPSDERLKITRIEVIRIRPQQQPDEPVGPLIEDVWRTFECDTSTPTCQVEFDDQDFPASSRDALYYVRAIQEPTEAANAGGLRCDDEGNCDPCYGDWRTDRDDDCMTVVEERAWSSPIYVRYEPEPEPPVLSPVEPEGTGSASGEVQQ